MAAQYATCPTRGPQAWSHADSWPRSWKRGAVRSRIAPPKAGGGWRRFPVIKTWSRAAGTAHPDNRLQVQHHCRLGFIQDKANVIFLGGRPWETAFGAALGLCAGLHGYAVLCASAMAVINTLAAAQARRPSQADAKNTRNLRCASSRSSATSRLTRQAPICSSSDQPPRRTGGA